MEFGQLLDHNYLNMNILCTIRFNSTRVALFIAVFMGVTIMSSLITVDRVEAQGIWSMPEFTGIEGCEWSVVFPNYYWSPPFPPVFPSSQPATTGQSCSVPGEKSYAILAAGLCDVPNPGPNPAPLRWYLRGFAYTCMATKVNCVGSWSSYGSCSASCGGGNQTRTYRVSVPASGGGNACPYAHGQTQSQSCNTGACPTYSCTGSVPANASYYSFADVLSLTANTPNRYSSKDTPAKCEFKCDAGNWNGSSCIVPSPTTYTYTFNGNGATTNPIPTSRTLAAGNTLSAPTNPARTGYTFNGWSPSIPTAMPVGGGSSAAQWTALPPNLTFTANPPSITAGNSSNLNWTVTGTADSCWASGGWTGWKTFSGSNSEAVSPLTTTTYNLECWNAGVSSGMKTALVTVVPVPTTYTYTFNGNGATTNPIPTSRTLAAGNTLSAPTNPARTGYTFNGWSPSIPTAMPVGGGSSAAQWTALPLDADLEPLNNIPPTSTNPNEVAGTWGSVVNKMVIQNIGDMPVPASTPIPYRFIIDSPSHTSPMASYSTANPIPGGGTSGMITYTISNLLFGNHDVLSRANLGTDGTVTFTEDDTFNNEDTDSFYLPIPMLTQQNFDIYADDEFVRSGGATNINWRVHTSYIPGLTCTVKGPGMIVPSFYSSSKYPTPGGATTGSSPTPVLTSTSEYVLTCSTPTGEYFNNEKTVSTIQKKVKVEVIPNYEES
jgi:hypothetical protein